MCWVLLLRAGPGWEQEVKGPMDPRKRRVGGGPAYCFFFPIPNWLWRPLRSPGQRLRLWRPLSCCCLSSALPDHMLFFCGDKNQELCLFA